MCVFLSDARFLTLLSRTLGFVSISWSHRKTSIASLIATRRLLKDLILLILLALNSDTRVGRQPDIQATPCPRWLSGSTPDRPPRASHT